MYHWIKKLHIYSGLLSYVGFTVWGIVGIWASFAPSPAERPRREPEVRTVAFQVDGRATDQEITDAMIVASGLPFIQPGRKPNRDNDGRLQVRYLTPNGTRRILLLERENLLQIERTPSPLGGFLNLMHMQTFRIHNPGWEVHLWGGVQPVLAVGGDLHGGFRALYVARDAPPDGLGPVDARSGRGFDGGPVRSFAVNPCIA